MKKVSYLMGLFMLLACFQLSAKDVKVDDIINNYLKNTGGAENWKK